MGLRNFVLPQDVRLDYGQRFEAELQVCLLRPNHSAEHAGVEVVFIVGFTLSSQSLKFSADCDDLGFSCGVFSLSSVLIRDQREKGAKCSNRHVTLHT